MEQIQELTKIDFSYVIISVFIILIAIKAMVSIFEWVVEKLGIETKWMRGRREEHNLLIQTSKNLAALQEQHVKDIMRSDTNDKEIQNELKELKDMFIQKEIEDTRWYINNFANRISEGHTCNKDSFKHCLKTYAHYEEILKEHNLTNGEVEISISIIKEAYRKKMEEGF